MSDRHEQRRLDRLVLDLTNGLKACRVLRRNGDLLGRHPFQAVGAATLLTTALAKMRPEIAEEQGLIMKLLPRLSPAYGVSVASELGLILEMALSEKHAEKTQRAVRAAEVWGQKIADGDTSAEMLEEAASDLGQCILDTFLNGVPIDGLELQDTGRRAEEIFNMGMELDGFDVQMALGMDAHHVRKAAFSDLVMMSATTHLYRCGKLDFDRIGEPVQLAVRMTPTTFGGCFLQSWIEQPGDALKASTPLQVLEALRTGWGKTISSELVSVLRSVEDYCRGVERAIENNAQVQPAAEAGLVIAGPTANISVAAAA